MPWYTFQLSSAQEAAGDGVKVLDQFEKVYIPLGGPGEVAMFYWQEPGEDHATYYLTPATEHRAELLLRLFGAKPGAPAPADATLMAGVAGKRPKDF